MPLVEEGRLRRPDVPIEPRGCSSEGLRIGIVASRFNQEVTDLLLKGAVEALLEAGRKTAGFPWIFL